MPSKSRLTGPLQSTVVRYAFAFFTVAIASGIGLLTTPLTGNSAFLLFLAGATLTTFFAGSGPGLVALLVGTPLAAFISLLRLGSTLSQTVFQSLVYSIAGAVLLCLTYSANRTRRNLQAANQQLRAANEEIRRSAERIREVIELAPDAFFLADLDAHYMDVNRAACSMLGYEREDLVGKKILDLIQSEEEPRLEAEKSVLLEGQSMKSEWLIRRRDGTLLPVEVSANIISGGRWQAFVRDMSDRKQRERELTESESRFRTLVEAVPQIVWIARPDGWNTYISQQWVTYSGLTIEESLGYGWNRPFHPDDRQRVLDAWQHAVQTDSAYSLECRIRRTDGAYHWFLVRCVSLHDDSGKVITWFGTATDVDDMKRAEEALRQARDKAEAASEGLRRSETALQRAVAARDQILGIVAHDLRNPLGTIFMQASALQRGGPEPDRRSRKPRDTILRAANRMNRLIQDLLDVALVEAERLKVKREQVAAAELIMEAVETQRSFASSAKIEVRLDLGEAAPQVWADHDRLLEVFENLIGNAIKFTEPGGRITVGSRAKEDEVLFWVSDTGCGIGPESLPHVFDRFWQAEEHAGRAGAGLGLPIAKGIIEAHDGRIWVESTLGRGSTFFFAIPTAYPATESPSDVIH
jgi:PAS domain S-box-containing protein